MTLKDENERTNTNELIIRINDFLELKKKSPEGSYLQTH